MHFYSHHIGDYKRETAHLSLVEHGVYRLLLDHYYATEKPLPNDLQLLYRIVGTQGRTERTAVARVVELFFVASSEGLEHPRVKEDIEQFTKRLDSWRTRFKSGKPGKPIAAEAWKPTETQTTIASWFHRPPQEPWSIEEVEALQAIGPVQSSDLALLQIRYTTSHPYTVSRRRKKLITLLQHWRGELDCARTAPREEDSAF